MMFVEMKEMTYTCSMLLADEEAVRLRDVLVYLDKTFGEGYSHHYRVADRAIVSGILHRMLLAALEYDPAITLPGRKLRFTVTHTERGLAEKNMLVLKPSTGTTKYISAFERRVSMHFIKKLLSSYDASSGTCICVIPWPSLPPMFTIGTCR
jgi:hypothetical protein